MLIVSKIDEGREVWGEITWAIHTTMNAGPNMARIHAPEFDVFYRRPRRTGCEAFSIHKGGRR